MGKAGRKAYQEIQQMQLAPNYQLCKNMSLNQYKRIEPAIDLLRLVLQ